MRDIPEDKDLLEARFGLIAIRKGYITKDHLIKALEIQVLEEIEFGAHRPVGEILSSQDIMSCDRIAEISSDISQGIHI